MCQHDEDLYDQRMYMQRTTQWRFTSALDAAVAQYVDEGGLTARGERFYQEVKKRGYIQYPGKLTEVDMFRVGCIGHFGEAGIPGAVAAIADTLKAMGVRRVSAEASA
ncbi:2-aminoethylphosphonate--pyruvate transaminase [Burkholderia ambifaria]